MKKQKTTNIIFIKAIILSGLLLALLVTPIYFFFGFKWAISIWSILMFTNIWSAIKKIINE